MTFKLDASFQYPVYSVICSTCRHWDHQKSDRRCTAFPDGIPDEIWLGENDHKSPFPDDNGVQYQQVEL
jgi:hypothetical protein